MAVRPTLLASNHEGGKFPAGFTLSEVMVTLLILVGFVAMLGTASLLMGVSRQSSSDTRAAHLARQIASDLTSGGSFFVGAISGKSQSSSATPGAPKAQGYMVNSLQGPICNLQSIDLSKAGTYLCYYSLDGLPVGANDPLNQYTARVVITPDSSRQGLSLVDVQIVPNASKFTWVDAAADTDSSSAKVGTPFRFLTKVCSPGLPIVSAQ